MICFTGSCWEISAREANYLVSYALGMSEEDCRAYEEERKRRPYMVSHVTASSLWNSFMMYRPKDWQRR